MPLPKSKAKPAPTERAVVHPEPTSELSVGDNGLTAEQMKVIMGWEVEEGDKKFGADYFTTDIKGRKVRAHNNVTNRPLYEPNVNGLKQEQLMRRWKFNGEPFIIGKTGLVLNGQHQGTALILAQQELDEGKDKDHWKEQWPDGIVRIDKLVVYGVEEDDAIVNTMDTCKPRTLADVIYRSEYFAKMKSGERRNASRMCEHAIKFLWERTGASSDPYAPRRTHAESLDFLGRHPSLLKAVKHIMEEDKGGKDSPANKVGNWLTCGYASGLMYLMGTSASDADEYHTASPPSEKHADAKKNWEKAEAFWVLLASGSAELQSVRDVLAGLHDVETGLGGTRDERIAVLVKAWNLWVNDGALTPKNLAPEYKATTAGGRTLAEIPNVGGLDLGKLVKQREEEPEPTEEEIAAEKERIKADKEAAKAVKQAEKDAAKEAKLRASQGDGSGAKVSVPVPPPAPAKANPKKGPTAADKEKAKESKKPVLKGGIGK